MSKSQIKFKNLTEDQTIQIIDLDDYMMGDGIPKATKPLTKLQFIKKYLEEIIDDSEGEVDVNEAFDMMSENDGGDSNKVFVTVVDGEVKVILS